MSHTLQKVGGDKQETQQDERAIVAAATQICAGPYLDRICQQPASSDCSIAGL